MECRLHGNFIEITGKEDFNARHILECGQIFTCKKIGNGYEVLSLDKKAIIRETECGYEIRTEDVKYFENFFDLKTDYGEIKKDLSGYPILKRPIEFGYGIRILKQDLFETLIGFIISSNNNIKRIQSTLTRLREKLGKKIGDYYAFPTRDALLKADERFFKEIGAGYRAKYLCQAVRQVDGQTLAKWQSLNTTQLRRKLIGLAGVGPKVADCVLLFGYGRGDVFPVDTWIHRMYNKFYNAGEPFEEKNYSKSNLLKIRETIRKNLIEEFGPLSGYAQQYLFYYVRSEGQRV